MPKPMVCTTYHVVYALFKFIEFQIIEKKQIFERISNNIEWKVYGPPE